MSSIPSFWAETLARCDIQATKGPSAHSERIWPTEFTGSKWAPLAQACSDGGWDVDRCGGSRVTEVELRTTETTAQGDPLVATIVTLGDTTCCVFKVPDLPPDSTSVGAGYIPVPCAPAVPAVRVMDECSAVMQAGPASQWDQTTEQIDLPSEFAEDEYWAPRAKACEQGGYDLARCAGNTVTSVEFSLPLSFLRPAPVRVWVTTLDDTVCCVYETDVSTPPILSPSWCRRGAFAQQVLEKCGADVGAPTARQLELPAELGEDDYWGARAKVCEQGGFDLTRCAGNIVASFHFDLRWSDADPYTPAWVITSGDTVCCIYEADGEFHQTVDADGGADEANDGSMPNLIPSSCHHDG